MVVHRVCDAAFDILGEWVIVVIFLE